MFTINCAECGDEIGGIKTEALAATVKDEIYCSVCITNHEEETEDEDEDVLEIEEVAEEKEEENA